jgi:hypothetical protein
MQTLLSCMGCPHVACGDSGTSEGARAYILGGYFLRAALLAEFLKEFFLAERISAVQ